MLDITTRGETERLASLAHLVQATGYRFITPTPATHARVNARPGNAWARTLTDVFGWSRPFREGVLSGPVVEAMRRADVLQPHEDGFRSAVRLSSLDDLLFLHSAYPTTAADSVFFGPDTYRFAQAIARVLDRPVRRAADIGCGAGPGAILVARAHPAAEVLALDINDSALRLTRANARLAGAPVEAARSDVLAHVGGDFDLIVANPPYMADPAARAYRDGGGKLGAALSLRILDAALDRLRPGATLLLYTGAAVVNGDDPFRNAAATRLARSDARWTYTELDPDVFGEELDTDAYAEADRIAAVVLVATRP